MTIINGRACVANGTPVDKVFSNGMQVYGRNLLAGIDKATHQATNWNQLVTNIPTKFIKSGQPLCFSVFINNAPYVKFMKQGDTHCSINANDSSGNILLSKWGNGINFDADGVSQASLIVPDKTDSVSLCVVTNNMGQNAYYGYPKAEFGSIATPWTPAPEDVM